ncbi:MAG: hypothetical protein IJU98_03410 [Synergistaceae bacterium]|nr:hypothetical protein [Synergistaceae bacterium]
MLLTEYDEAATMEMFREDGRREGRLEGQREGRREGRREGYFQALASLVRDGLLSLKDAALKAQMTEDMFSSQMGPLTAL